MAYYDRHSPTKNYVSTFFQYQQRFEELGLDSGQIPISAGEAREIADAISLTVVDGRLHSENGLPSLVTENGKMIWHKNGKYHRLDGPAIVNIDGGNNVYLIDGDPYFTASTFQAQAELTDEEMTLIFLEYGNKDLK